MGTRPLTRPRLYLGNKVFSHRPPLFFSALPFPRLHITVPWTHPGRHWQHEFLCWPFDMHLTEPASFLFHLNQFNFYIPSFEE